MRRRGDGTLSAESGIVSVGVASTACLVGLGTILPVLVYQIDYNVPLGFPKELVLVATAATLSGAGLRRSDATAGASADGSGAGRWALVAVSCALVLVGTSIAGAAWVTNRASVLGASEQPGASSGVLVSWNVHYGVTPAGSVDLEAIAHTIEAQDPDAVLLQEVSRGWVQGGGVDMATWLSNRLGRQFVFAPAADRRFGNVIMSRGEPEMSRSTPCRTGRGRRTARRSQLKSASAKTR